MCAIYMQTLLNHMQNANHYTVEFSRHILSYANTDSSLTASSGLARD